MKKIFLACVMSMSVFGCEDRKEDGNMHIQNEVTYSACVGRTLLDIPGSLAESPITTGIFKNAGSGPQAASFNVTVSAAGMTRPQFVAATQKRRAQLKNAPSQTVDVLRLDREVDADTILFRVQRIDDAYVSEVNCLVPCDHIPRRSWPLFRAKAMLGELIAGFSSPGLQSHQEQLAA